MINSFFPISTTHIYLQVWSFGAVQPIIGACVYAMKLIYINEVLVLSRPTQHWALHFRALYNYSLDLSKSKVEFELVCHLLVSYQV